MDSTLSYCVELTYLLLPALDQDQTSVQLNGKAYREIWSYCRMFEWVSTSSGRNGSRVEYY